VARLTRLDKDPKDPPAKPAGFLRLCGHRRHFDIGSCAVLPASRRSMRPFIVTVLIFSAPDRPMALAAVGFFAGGSALKTSLRRGIGCF